jgi:hypothetical protein
MSKILVRGKIEILPDGSRWRTGPVVQCWCSLTQVKCNNAWANECPTCHTEYNGAGQRLASRSQWGEETGEVF